MTAKKRKTKVESGKKAQACVMYEFSAMFIGAYSCVGLAIAAFLVVTILGSGFGTVPL